MNVLITGSRAPVAILLARALHAVGVRVYTADSLRPNFGQVSRAVTEDFLLPSPRFAPEACLAELARLAQEKQLDAILPTCEETFALSAGRAALPPPVRLLCPSIDILEKLHHKGRGIAFAARLGVATPETCPSPDLQRDGILKRAYSRFSSHVIPLRGSEAQRRRAAATKPEDGADWVWQAWVEGQALCTYSLCSRGELLAHAAYRTPYTVGLGAGIFYDTAQGDAFEASLAVVRTLAAATGYTGSLSLDFIEEPGGRLVLIELNPRATMGVCLLTHQPAFAACLGTVLAGSTFGAGELVAGRGARQLKAAVLLLGRRRRWREVLTTPDVLTDSRDPGPARAALRLYATYAWRARVRHLSPTAFTTHDLEWNG